MPVTSIPSVDDLVENISDSEAEEEQEDHDQDVHTSEPEPEPVNLVTPANKKTTVNVADLPTPPLSPELLSQRKPRILNNPAVKRKLDFTKCDETDAIPKEKAIAELEQPPTKQQAVVNPASSSTLLVDPTPSTARRALVATTTKLCVTLQAMCRSKYYRYIPAVLEFLMEKYSSKMVNEHLIPFLQSIHYNAYNCYELPECDHWEPAFLTCLVMPCDNVHQLIAHLDALVNFDDQFNTYVNERFNRLKLSMSDMSEGYECASCVFQHNKNKTDM